MSVYVRSKEKTYDYDFWIDGRRFTGRTGETDRRAAKRAEDLARTHAKAAIAADKAVSGGPLTLQAATERYWIEVGQHHAQSSTTLTDLLRLRDYFGDTLRLSDISDAEVAKLVAWRRAQTVKGRATVRDPADPKGKRTIAAARLAPATVNRSTTEVLQKLFTRARRVWRVALPAVPTWRLHRLKEPDERVREVKPHEDALLWTAIRADYQAVIHFALEAGLRQGNCLLRKDQVDLATGHIQVVGKGGKIIVKRITSAMRAILMAEMANPTPYVFTYAARRALAGKGGHARGQRLPITQTGLKTVWRRARELRHGKAASVPADLRFHDLRHDFATKLLRETRNIKLVQKALDHSKIETTMRYAHVLDEEVFDGMEAASARRKSNRS